MRHLGKPSSASAVWLPLFAPTVASLDTSEETEDVQMPADGWKQAVIRTLLAHVFHNVPEGERLSRLAELRSGEQIGTLMALLSAAAQEVTKTSSLIGSRAERAADKTLEVVSE